MLNNPSNNVHMCLLNIILRYFKEIIDCDYTKTAMLCGIEAAHHYFCISQHVFSASVHSKCNISDKEPIVKDALNSVEQNLKFKNSNTGVNTGVNKFNLSLILNITLFLYQFISWCNII